MASNASSDPDYVRALEQQIQRIERENRRLKREVITLSPSSSASGTEGQATSSRKAKADPDRSKESFLLEDLEDIDLNEVLDIECEDSWIYKSPLRPTSADANITPEQWLSQGLDGGPVGKNRDSLMDVRRDLSSLLSAESASNGLTEAMDDRSPSPASPGSVNSQRPTASGSTYAVSPSKSYLHSNEVSPSSLPTSGSVSLSSSRGHSPVSEDHRQSTPSPQPSRASTTRGTPSQSRLRAAPSSGAGSRLSPASSDERVSHVRSTSPQHRSLAPASSGKGSPSQRSGLAQPAASGARAPPASHLPGPSSRLVKPAPSPGSGLRAPTTTSAKPRIGAGSPTSARPTSSITSSGISRPASSGIPAKTTSSLPRSGLTAPAKSGLRPPRKSLPPGTSSAKGANDWREGCY